MIIKAISTGARLSPFSLLLNPTFWIVLLVWTALAAGYAYDYGMEKSRLEQQTITVKALEEQIAASSRVLKAERALRTADNAAFITFKEKQEHEQKITGQLVADLRSDNRRLRVPVRRPICAGPAAAGGPATTGPVEEGHSELTADAGEFLVGLLARGDDGIRKHAEVVDRYERLRTACTAPPPEIAP